MWATLAKVGVWIAAAMVAAGVIVVWFRLFAGLLLIALGLMMFARASTLAAPWTAPPRRRRDRR